MVLQIKKTATREALESALKKIKNGKPFNPKKHLGKLKFPIDALVYQKIIRDEWK